jgi:hypothetical protein
LSFSPCTLKHSWNNQLLFRAIHSLGGKSTAKSKYDGKGKKKAQVVKEENVQVGKSVLLLHRVMKGTSHERRRSGTYDTGHHVDLPAQLVCIVVKHFLDADAYGTWAATNVSNQALYNETLPDIWNKVVLWPAKI